MTKQIALISELVTIDHGKYVVKVCASSQGVILGTGLAAADTIEVAEDRARERTMAIINPTLLVSNVNLPSPAQPISSATNSQPQPQKQSQTNSANFTTTEKLVRPKLELVSDTIEKINQSELPESSPQNLDSFSSQSNSAITENLTPDLPLETSPVNVSETKLTSDNFIEDKSVQSDINNGSELREKQEIAAESQSSLPIQFSAQTSDIKAKQEDKHVQTTETKTMVENIAPDNLLDSSTYSSSETQAVSTNQFSANEEEIMDFAQIIDETTIEMKRLSWTQEQGRKYLLETYGKKSRHLLSDEELIEFLEHLKAQ